LLEKNLFLLLQRVREQGVDGSNPVIPTIKLQESDLPEVALFLPSGSGPAQTAQFGVILERHWNQGYSLRSAF